MTKKQQNNNQGVGCLAGIKTMISGLLVIFGSYCGLLLKNYLCHGVSGIARRKKRSSNTEDVLLPIISISTLIGSNSRCFAVMIIETLCLPRSVIFSKDIFLNKTAFLIPCFAGLFVGEYHRVLQEHKGFILECYQTLTNIVCFVVFKFRMGA